MIHSSATPRHRLTGLLILHSSSEKREGEGGERGGGGGGGESMEHCWEVTINHTNPHPEAGLRAATRTSCSCCVQGRLEN